MRVLDDGSTHTYKMGKNRKHRIRKSKENEAEDSSDDGVTVCSHIAKAVNFAAMRKALLKPNCTFGECTTCALEATKSGAKDLFGSPLEGAAASEVEDSDLEPTIWVCLQCGHQGCDRNSKERHALKHFETPHSGIHCVVANLTTWSAWCYTCDNDIPVEMSKRILECIDFLRKQAGLSRMEISHFPSQRGVQSDISPTDPGPYPSQPRTDKTHVTGKSPVMTCQKIKGLSNLGNTCFFNAVMQNLCQTHSLETLLVSGCKKGWVMAVGGWREPHSDSDSSGDGDEEEDIKLKELSVIEIVPGDPGPLTNSLLNFVQEMNNGSTHSTVTPNALFSHVCKKAPRFKGFQQQDSHELLRYLVDVVRNEEIKRAQSGILKYFKLPESVNPKKVDEETKTKIKEYGRQVKFTFLDSLFGGQLVSTVTCEECKHISQIIEPFLDLSLPVTEEKPQRPNQVVGGRRKDSITGAGGDPPEEVVPSVGVDGFAERSDKPSKYMERKCKRQMKKEAKRKSRAASRKDAGVEQEKAVEEDKESPVTDLVGAKGSTGDSLIGSSNNSADREEDNTSDPSDADVEDNLESETSRLQVGNYESNLHSSHISISHHKANSSNIQSNNCCDSDGDASSATDLSIKMCTVKENHILPTGDLSQSGGDSQPASLDSMGSGIKEEENRHEVEKQANSISNLELDNVSDVDRTQEGSLPSFCKSHKTDSSVLEDCSSKADFCGWRGEGVLVNHCDSRANHSMLGAPELHQRHALGSINDSPGQREVEWGSKESTIMGADGDGSVISLERDLEEKLTFGVEPSPTGSGGFPNTEKNTVPVSNHKASKSAKEVQREARYKSKTTLAPRYHPSSKECSVMSCLHQFTAAELLTGSNKVGCKVCTKLRLKNAASLHKDKKGSETVYSNAAKQFLIMIPPAVLTLHLKRFEQVGYTSRKVNRHVEFPLILDLAPYCSSLCQDVKSGQRRVLYSLYGVVEHSGRLQTGHYTAYVKVRPSLGPVTNFLHTHTPNPMDYIQRMNARRHSKKPRNKRMKYKGLMKLKQRYTEQIQNGPSSVEEDVSDELSVDALIPPGRWYHVSDSRINEVTETTVLKAQAYLLFYERVC